jgi:hypothetical protein
VCKRTNKTKSYINGSSVHWTIGRRRSCGVTICGGTGIANGHRGGRCCWGGSTTIHISVGINKNIKKGDGHWDVWIRCYSKQKATSWIRLHFWKKVFAFQILNDSCGYKQKRTMIGMLKGWRIRRISVRKKIGLLKKGLFLCLWWIGNHAQCHARIFEYICYQGHKYLLWA